jgi:2-polyprenyl-3-methyl-5-hydroxy-6-metoxy-1,4-benzoquinol methylase
MSATSYPDQTNPDLLDRIPLDARTILDVGCGTGALARDYKLRNPAAKVYGIELDAQVARLARERMDELAVCDVEAQPLPFGDTRFDCIIYGDILEHLRDPWAVLARHAPMLTESGTALICVPNADHWSFAFRLLRGNFDYEDQGLFDRTHLRWFTFATMGAALTKAGLHPHDVTGRVFDAKEAENFTRLVEPVLAAMGVDRTDYLNRARPLQHVWRARHRALPQMRVISTMLAPVGGVSQVRVIEPMRALSTDPTITAMVNNGFDIDEPGAEAPKVFIFHRPLLAGDAGLEPIRQLLSRNYVVVCEFDDHPDYIPVLQRPDVQNFRAVHAIQTSTEALAAVLRRENPEVIVFPNAIGSLPPVRNYTDPGRVTLFFGGLNREQDWPPYVEALNAVAAFAGERLHFEIVNDRALFDALQTPHKNFTPLCDYPTYMEILGRCEVSFMPLLDTPFNRCKSDLKYLEAAASRVTALASPVVYGETIADGRTGMLFRDATELQRRLARVVVNPEIGRVMGDAARGYVARHRMGAYQVARRAMWYRSLWARREELNAALLARVPELVTPALVG